MTKLYFSILFILSMATSNAQINLVGAATSPNGGIDILKWEALNPESVTVHQSMLTGYYMGSSAFDAYNSTYFLTGITNTSQGLFSFNTQTLQQNLSSGSNFTNISEFDMSTGKLYDLRMDSTDYFSVNEFTIATGTDSLLGIIHEPGADGLVVDAIGFDANNGILYYVGFTNEPALYLYAIPVREELFSYTRTPLTGNSLYNSLTSLNYDNVNDKLFALNALWDTSGNFLGNEVVEIDYTTGSIITRSPLPGIIGFVASSSSFDQYSSSLMLLGLDTNYNLSMIVFNTQTNTYVTGFVPGNVSEVACDNTLFAMNTYGVTQVPEDEEVDFSVYPNPTAEKLSITTNYSKKTVVQIFNQTGQLVHKQDFFGNALLELPLKGFKSGLYLVNITAGKLSQTRKIVVNNATE